MIYLHSVWLLFVAWLMREAFGFTPETVMGEHRELVAARTENDRLRTQLIVEHERVRVLRAVVGDQRKEIDDLVGVAIELRCEIDAKQKMIDKLALSARDRGRFVS